MERKEIVKQLGEHFGVKPKYMGVPSCNYQIQAAEETYTVDRAGKIINSEGKVVEFEKMLQEPETEKTESLQNPRTAESETTTFEVAVPMDAHTGITLRNLVNMIYSKQALIKKALVVTEDIVGDNFSNRINEVRIETLEDFKTAIGDMPEKSCSGIAFDFDANTITFKFLEGEVNPEKVEAYTQLVALLNQNAKILKYASAKVKDTDNDKFAFRVFLIRLGMVGDEYKMTRKVLLEKLDGNSAFRSGKPEKKTEAVIREQ